MPTCAGSRERHVVARSSATPLRRRISMPHPAIIKDNVAVITCGASGIGFAAAMPFARADMKVCIADVDQGRLTEAVTKLSSVTATKNVMTFVANVSKSDSSTERE